jgi:hypothetical protein
MSKNTETQANEESSGVDILSFDVVTPCENARPLQMKDAKGNLLPITFFVLGAHASAVKSYIKDRVKNDVAAEVEAKKNGTEVQNISNRIDTGEFNSVNGAAVRVNGWSGVTQKFNPQILKMALQKNPHWIDDIVKYSETIGNFT